MIRLIVSDMDGTLLSGHDDIHPDNLSALRQAIAQGVHFAVASGRRAEACRRIMREHGLDNVHIIGMNGCQVLDAKHTLTKEAALAAWEALASCGINACFCAEHADVYAVDGMRSAFLRGGKPEMFDPALLADGMHHFSGEEAMRALLEYELPAKIFASYLPGPERSFDEARAACLRVPGVTVTSSWHNNIEVMPVGVDKGAALQELCAQLGIAREEVIAFGDNENDLPMLRWAGLGYAMANGTPAVLSEIPRHTGACTDGGVAQALRQWIPGIL